MPSTTGDPGWCSRHRCDMKEFCGQCLADECAEHITADRERIADLEAALLEAARHVMGKCDCAKQAPGLPSQIVEVGCAQMTERALSPFVEVGEAPEYAFRLRAIKA